MALRFRAALVVAVGLVGASALAISDCTSGSVRREAGLRVLLVTVDTLRADALGAYGRAGAETPWMDRLAAEGVRFAEARAQNVVTLPSHANILSGRYPPDHGVRDNSGFRFPAGQETLATVLKAQGYRTGAFVSAFPLDSRFGLDRGFDVYDDRFANVDTHTAFEMEERSGPETVALARDWIRAQGDSPWLCWVHLYEPHFPYAPPAPLRERFAAAPYQGEVAAADAALGPLLEDVLVGGDRSALVVLTADHGESLGEHGEPTHGIFAYEATLRVPLVLHAPRILRPRVVREPVRHVDVLPPSSTPSRFLRPRASPAAASWPSRRASRRRHARATSRRSPPPATGAGRLSSASCEDPTSTWTSRCRSSTTWPRTPRSRRTSPRRSRSGWRRCGAPSRASARAIGDGREAPRTRPCGSGCAASATWPLRELTATARSPRPTTPSVSSPSTRICRGSSSNTRPETSRARSREASGWWPCVPRCRWPGCSSPSFIVSAAISPRR